MWEQGRGQQVQGPRGRQTWRPRGLWALSGSQLPASNLVLEEGPLGLSFPVCNMRCQAILEAFSGSKGCVQLSPAPACSWCSASLRSFSSQELGERPQYIWQSQGRALAGMERILLLVAPCGSALTFSLLPMRKKLLSFPFYKWRNGAAWLQQQSLDLH